MKKLLSKLFLVAGLLLPISNQTDAALDFIYTTDFLSIFSLITSGALISTGFVAGRYKDINEASVKKDAIFGISMGIIALLPCLVTMHILNKMELKNKSDLRDLQKEKTELENNVLITQKQLINQGHANIVTQALNHALLKNG